MEKIEKREVVSIEVTHIYTCDCCGKEIGRSVELKDGHASSFGKINKCAAFGNYTIDITGHLCNECESSISNEFIDKARCFFESKHLIVKKNRILIE